MFNLSLTACSFSLRKINKRGVDSVINLNDPIKYIDKESGEICKTETLSIFDSFFKSFSLSFNDEKRKKTFSCFYKNDFYGETKNYIYTYVLIKSGIYGSSSEIISLDTKKLVYKKKANDVEEKPFYLFVVFPKDSPSVKVQKGIFIFQNVGQYGIKTITTDYMKNYFSNKFDISLTCKTVAPNIFIEKILKRENITKLYLTKNHKSNDTADNLFPGYGVETKVLAKLNFSMPIWQKILDNIKYFVAGKYNLFEFVDSDKYDGVKLSVDIGGSERMINLRNINNLSIIEKIPDEIKGVDGHPKKDELIAHLQKVTDEYLEEMVLSITK